MAGQTLGNIFNPQKNSFGFIRFILASLVVFSHSFVFVIPDFEPLASLSNGTITFGTMAVSVFFIVSGFLITRSYVNGSSIVHFIRNRFLRLYPGFWVCLLITSFVFAPLASYFLYNDFSLSTQNPSYTSLGYILHNITIKIQQTSINNNSGILVSNNSLWTLYYEGLCYIAVAGFGYLGFLKKRQYIIPLTFSFIIILLIIGHFFPQYHVFSLFVPWKMTLYRLSSCFFAGACIYLYADRIPYSPVIALMMGVLYIMTIPMGITEITDALLLSYPVLVVGFSPLFAWTDNYGDFSYGTYLYAFPIQTLLHHAQISNYGLVVFFIASLSITLIVAIASYYFVEKPCLALKHTKKKRYLHTS